MYALITTYSITEIATTIKVEGICMKHATHDPQIDSIYQVNNP